ncbi:threonine dehydrogenase-like Zn-dependent dehydrogenase [Crossiella equi]|uniref:Threonine dehydrogenase-like Zn-dependent dehydrogenase n=1 Tax=Crossiella equi TaxID=130796 RepID=A0ABS5AS04_9PSEU|nr:hypothetical protein [Crossiella equi]MBP2478480.1 threonine dehydrogenase-like Zn-dependent dehydrogenase [Crossiella equi]
MAAGLGGLVAAARLRQAGLERIHGIERRDNFLALVSDGQAETALGGR